MSEDQKQEQVKEEVVEEQIKEVAEEVKEEADRPEENFKAELARKNARIAQLEAERATRSQEPAKRDPSDIRTWPDHELRLLKKDPQFAQYHDQADDILLERKVAALDAKRQESERRVKADLEFKEQYPDASDPTSPLSQKIEELMSKYDLSKTPAGRLVAAKLASTELNKGRSATDSVARKKEQNRVASVKGQMVDGDRAKPTQDVQKDLDSKRKDLSEKLITGKSKTQQEALGDVLKDRFGGAEGFFSGFKYTGRKE